jgi:hypothetical protein
MLSADCLDMNFCPYAKDKIYIQDEQKPKGECMPQVSFATDIKPLFRDIDIAHMKRFGVKLDDYTYMSNPANADAVLATLSPRDDEPPSMPPGGPHWTADQLNLFVRWQKDGYQP